MRSRKLAKNEIILSGKLLSDKGFIAGSDGNLSARLDNGNILITRSGVKMGDLASDDLILINSSGEKLEGSDEPSSEMGMHLTVYKNRSDVNAVVHAHPPYTTSFAVTGRELPENYLPEVILFVGRIPLTKYAPPGTKAVASSIEPFLPDCNAFMLRSHGLLTLGKSCEEALNRHETVEHYAKIVSIALQLGTLKELDKKEIEQLTELRNQLQETVEPDCERDNK